MARTDRARQELGLSRSAVPTPPDLAGPEARLRGRQPDIRGTGHLQTTTDGVAIDGDDDGLAYPPDGVRIVGAGIKPVAVLPVGAVAVEVGDVAAGGEGTLTGAGEQEGVDGIVVVGLVGDGVHLAVHGH